MENKKETKPKQVEKIGNKNTQKKDSEMKDKKDIDKKAKKAPLKKEKGKKRLKSKFLSSPVIIGIANVFGVILLIFILGLLTNKADELKKLRNISIGSEAKVRVETADLEIQSNIEKSDRLISIFPDESGLVDFVKEIEKLKEVGVVKDFSFANEDAIPDKTKSIGIPFVVELEGTWEEIGNDLQVIQKLPFLIRTITVNTKIKEDETNLIILRYGGFIYVNESLGKN